MTILPVLPTDDCWNRIGVRGDRSCPELPAVVHCHNCRVFAAAGRRFLDAPSPPGYLDEWTRRLAAPPEVAATDLQGGLIFRLAEEWLALPVRVLVEVTGLRPVHRIPFRGGLLAGVVNIRGELHLCVHLARLVGFDEATEATPAAGRGFRLLVVSLGADRWVFPVDEVEQVHRISVQELGKVPATVARAAARLTRGVFNWQGKAVGLLDEARLAEALRAKLP